MPRHFLDIARFDADELRAILDDAKAIKAAREAVAAEKPLAGKMLAMIFDKPSTRTRVSFDVGMRQLGGETLILDSSGSQIGTGETIADTARVLSRYVDAIMIRTTEHDRLLEMAEYATVPVINALTDDTHPCQILADVMTWEEHRGSVKGKTMSWYGDGNNVLHSFLEAAPRFGFDVNIAVPEGHDPQDRYVAEAQSGGSAVQLIRDAAAAAQGADLIVTDKWVSMGQEKAGGHNTFAPYQVNEQIMKAAKDDALFMHCLPAKRGEEVTDAVIDGPQSVVFDEAENRLHAQKSILMWSLAPGYKPPQI
ncbi:ornithine carbamoyltransferase [Pseudahrensia aquimaris]|uniref:Ornithine carbamoyltransferase n=1 Tax=Pseudahrensia aquimaris TaxID=744461 RepID=A0ABW3FHW2_9HYPH